MTISSEVREILAIIGWLILVFSILRYGWGVFLKKYAEKLDRDFKKKALTDPFVAFRQIIELEVTINKNNIEHERQRLNDEGSLKFWINEFNKRFPFTSVESFRKHVEEKSSANR